MREEVEVLLQREGMSERCRALQVFSHTPLHLAAARGHVTIVEKLLAAGADKDAKDNVSGEDAECGGFEGKTHPFVQYSFLVAFSFSYKVMGSLCVCVCRRDSCGQRYGPHTDSGAGNRSQIKNATSVLTYDGSKNIPASAIGMREGGQALTGTEWLLT